MHVKLELTLHTSRAIMRMRVTLFTWSNIFTLAYGEMSADDSQGYDCDLVEKSKFQTNCLICLLVLRKPTQVRCCGYIFCAACIGKALRDQNSACPMCQQQNPSIFPDRNMERLLSGCKVYCTHRAKRRENDYVEGRRDKPRRGCEWEGDLAKLEKHLNENPSERTKMDGCLYVKIKCKFCDDFFKRFFIQEHQLNHCPKRRYTCSHCEYRSTYIEITEEHMPVCPSCPMKCPHCWKMLKRSKFDHHVNNECAHAPVDCDFHLSGCKVQLPKDQMKKHIDNNGVHHVQMFLEYAKEHGDVTLNQCLPMITSSVDTLTVHMHELSTLKAKLHIQYEFVLEYIEEKNNEKMSALKKKNNVLCACASALLLVLIIVIIV